VGEPQCTGLSLMEAYPTEADFPHHLRPPGLTGEGLVESLGKHACIPPTLRAWPEGL